jgi:glycosyltransferase involved in cell wall biosynthesis
MISVGTNVSSVKKNSLPRLLYVGDVPVTSTLAGAALLYRLLQSYPASCLRIVEGNLWSGRQEWGHDDPEKRLPNVAYGTLKVGVYRLLSSRWGSIYSGYLQRTAPYRATKLARTIRTFKPDAILTVAHGFSWLTAATLAAKHRLPLHLIVHDDWEHLNQLPRVMKAWGNEQFGMVYRQAKSRLCASRYMVDAYERRYGAPGIVLYPSRGLEDVVFDAPSAKKSRLFPTFAYAGSINIGGYARCLSDLASVLEEFSGSVLLFSPHSKQDLKKLGLEKPNIIPHSLIPQNQLVRKLRDEADVLFAPMTFEPEHRDNMAVGFPSKMTDYTATGRPILVWGPSYCSAIRWSLENPGVAEVVSENDTELLKQSVARLVGQSDYRVQLGSAALEKGIQYFSHAAVTERFYQSITPEANCNQSNSRHCFA